jgi:transcriptional regulator with XRE-family HTH domain
MTYASNVERTLVDRRGKPTKQDPLLVETVAIMRRFPGSLEDIAEVAEVHPATLKNWLEGNVLLPRIDKLQRVLQAMGRRLLITDDGSFRVH